MLPHMREPKTCTEMATEKPTLPAPEEQVSPAAEDAQANPAVTVRVPEPEMPAAGPAAEASAAAEEPVAEVADAPAESAVTETPAAEASAGVAEAPAAETPAEEAAAERISGEEAAPRAKRARIKPAAGPEVAESEEDASRDVQVDFADEEAALAAQNAGLEIEGATPEEEAAEELAAQKPEEDKFAGKGKEELVALFARMLEEQPVQSIRRDVEALKIAFYRIRRAEVEAARRRFVEEGGAEEDFAPSVDGAEIQLKEQFKEYRRRRDAFIANLEAEKEANLKVKQAIIEELKELVNSDETLNHTFNKFRELQQRWKDTGIVPQQHVKDLWETYNLHVENFYSFIKINKELRDLDLKKNYEQKVALCEQAEALMPGVEAIVVLDKTPFYAEMGGQIGDQGTLTADGVTFAVTDVQKNKGGKYMHYGKLTQGTLKVGDTVTAALDVERRKAIMRAHSATHLLDKALRTVLGDHVHQAGSLVEPDRLRFDFTHFSALTAQELGKVNAIVNEAVLEGYDIVTQELPIEEAKKKGAIALFGEKYGDTVRVVDMGSGYSVEFCGGTHLDNTAKVGVFHISSEFSVASGVRRIEATTGKASLAVMNRNQEMLFQAASVLKAKPGELREKAEAVMAEVRQLSQSVEKFKAREAVSEAERFLFSGHDVGGLKVLTATVPEADANRLRKMGDFLRDKEPKVVAVLAAVNGEKITFLAVCGKDAVKAGVKAGDIIKQVSAIAGGSGGGKPDSAMGGGKDPLMVDNALAMVDNVVSMKLGV